MNALFDLSPAISAARDEGRPLVALESTAIAHGLPWPRNLETARAMEAAVRGAGAEPATLALRGGRVMIGMDDNQLESLARAEEVAKVSRRDFGPVLASGGWGATTVAGTLILASACGIKAFGTGGIGGVHPGAGESFDLSADLTELARQRVAVVCSGAKSILDLPATFEVLETQGVPVLAYGQENVPAFYLTDSGLPALAQADRVAELAAVAQAHWALGLESGLVIANPISSDAALNPEDLAGWTEEALAEAQRKGIAGKEVTPFLLQQLFVLSDGKTLEANITLLIDNAGLAGELAVELAKLT